MGREVPALPLHSRGSHTALFNRAHACRKRAAPPPGAFWAALLLSMAFSGAATLSVLCFRFRCAGRAGPGREHRSSGRRRDVGLGERRGSGGRCRALFPGRLPLREHQRGGPARGRQRPRQGERPPGPAPGGCPGRAARGRAGRGSANAVPVSRCRNARSTWPGWARWGWAASSRSSRPARRTAARRTGRSWTRKVRLVGAAPPHWAATRRQPRCSGLCSPSPGLPLLRAGPNPACGSLTFALEAGPSPAALGCALWGRWPARLACPCTQESHGRRAPHLVNSVLFPLR